MNYKSKRWRRKRESVLRRDGYQCQISLRYGKRVEADTVHHILPADKFPEYDDWLFTPEDPAKGWYPRTIDAANRKAAELLGSEEALFEATRNAAISAIFSKSFDLFGRTTMQGKNGIPRLVYKSQWIIPEVDTPEGLMEILNTVFDIPVTN